VSLLDCWTSGGTKAPVRDLFWHFPGYLGAGQNTWRTTPAGAIRSGEWKLLEFFETNQLELYNLLTDEGQQHNRAAQEPEKVKELHTRLRAWRKSVQAPMPTANKPK
jgi:arylsulfatase A-like enzyme